MFPDALAQPCPLLDVAPPGEADLPRERSIEISYKAFWDLRAWRAWRAISGSAGNHIAPAARSKEKEAAHLQAHDPIT